MNNLSKGSNSKFVMNLFKSLGIACAVIAVNSCNDKPKNDNNNDKAAAKLLGDVKSKLKDANFDINNEKKLEEFVGRNSNLNADEIVNKIISDKSDKRDLIVEKTPTDVKETPTKTTPVDKGQSKKTPGTPAVTDEKITGCSGSLKDVKSLVSDEGVDFNSKENREALLKLVEDKVIELKKGDEFLKTRINNEESFNLCLDLVDLLIGKLGYKDIKVVMLDESFVDILGGSKNDVIDYKDRKVSFKKPGTKVKVSGGDGTFKINIGTVKNIDCIDARKLGCYLSSLGSIDGSKDFFESELVLEWKKDFGAGECKIGANVVFGLTKGNVEEFVEVFGLFRSSGMFKSILEGYKVEQDGGGNFVNNNAAGTHVMKIEVKNFGFKSTEEKKIRKFFSVLLGVGENSFGWDGDANRIIVHCDGDNNVVFA